MSLAVNEIGNVVQTGHDQPSGINAEIATGKEIRDRRMLSPRKPESHSAQKEKYIDTDVAHPT